MASDREIRANTEILGEEIGRKSGLGKSAKYRSATFTVSEERVEGGLFTEYWLSHQSRLVSQEGGENVF